MNIVKWYTFTTFLLHASSVCLFVIVSENCNILWREHYLGK